MMRIVILFMSLTLWASAVEMITPTQEISIDGVAKDMVISKGNLYVGTDEGKMQVYNFAKKQIVYEVKFPNIKDFTGEVIPTRVSSLDHMEGRSAMLTDSGIGGYANVWIHENNITTPILTHHDKRVLVKLRFIDKDHILLGYLGNEASLLNLKTKKESYRVQLSPSKFSDFALNADRNKAAFGCESGVITVIDIQSGKTLKELKGVHRDNTFKVDFKNDTVSGAGQDRVGSIYSVSSGRGDLVKGSFLIYSTGLSPSAEKVAFALDEDNSITVFKTSNKSKLAILKGQKSTLNTIIFIDENTIVSASDDDTVMLWKLP